jgi:hypothetical protein
MADITTTLESSIGFTAFVLSQMRVAFVRSRCLTNEIETAGVSLRGGLVSPEDAIAAVIAAGGGGLLTWTSSHDQ